MGDDDLWERLLAFLNGWSDAREIGPGRVLVTVEDRRRRRRDIEIRMRPGEWDMMATVMWGDVDAALQEVRRSILRLQHHEPFLVYGDDELCASTSGERR